MSHYGSSSMAVVMPENVTTKGGAENTLTGYYAYGYYAYGHCAYWILRLWTLRLTDITLTVYYIMWISECLYYNVH